jgi:hypothetical protein
MVKNIAVTTNEDAKTEYLEAALIYKDIVNVVEDKNDENLEEADSLHQPAKLS